MTENPGFLERLTSLNPAVVRGVVVAVVALIVLITGKAIDDSTVDVIANVILLLLPIVAGLFIRPAVTANAKVIALKPDPVGAPNVIAPGEATVTPEQAAQVVDAAVNTPRAA
jgi:hypothetical protein